MHSAQFESKLNGPHLLDAIDEKDDGITHTIQAIFPSLCIQFTLNSLAVRFFQPRGTAGSADHAAFLEMGGRDVEPSKTSRATEVAIRGFWTGYRGIMDFG